MQKNNHFSFLLTLLGSLFKLFILVLTLMSFSRVYLFLSHATLTYKLSDLVSVFWLGIRLDASVLAYIFAPVVLIVFLVWLLHMKFLDKWLYGLFRFYFIAVLTLLFVITFSDLAYFSFFGSHATIMIFGVFDDDTMALLDTAFKNYNIPIVALFSLLFLSLVYFLIFKILKQKKIKNVELKWSRQLLFFLVLIVITGVTGRGSVGVFPLAYDVPDVSADAFLNELPQTPTYAMLDSYEQYKKSKSNKYDLIAMAGYKGKIVQAFEDYKHTKNINKKNLLANLIHTTPVNKTLAKKKPNVVLITVESFGAPILSYQSKKFNIMGRLKKHFDEDTVFTNFISASNGTIVSIEPLLLNITARPHSTPFGQSKYLNTSFYQASARVYQKAGYETSFIYGGDLSWRNVGKFFPKQGFDHVEGKAAIATALGKNPAKISHVWGVFDPIYICDDYK